MLLIDNGCDQSIINKNSFCINVYTGTYYNVDGAIEGMSASNLELVNDAVTCVIRDDGPNF